MRHAHMRSERNPWIVAFVLELSSVAIAGAGEPGADFDGNGLSMRNLAITAASSSAPPPLGHRKDDEVRKRPQDSAVELSFTYVADYFQNLHGGLNTNQSDQYRGLAILEATLDTEQFGLWEDGTFYLSLINNHGTDITERHVGDLQAVNNADAPNDTRLYEVWYEHNLYDGALRIRLGKMDANADFAGPEYGAEFVHSSAGFSPTIPFPTWPDPALGIVASLEPSEAFYLRGGVYDANGAGTRSGFETAFHSPEEVVALVEMGFSTTLDLFGQTNLPGTYRIGGFYHSGRWEQFPATNDKDGKMDVETGNAGVYVVIDQLFDKEDPDNEENEQGLGAYFQFGWAPSDRNEISQHYGWGLQYVGLVDGRDEDIAGFAMHHVSLSGRVQSLEGRFSETAFEAFYKFQVSASLSIKPDLQYVINPGGDGRDALLAGVRVEFSF